MTGTNRKPVPAVRQVLQIFEFLRTVKNTPQTLSGIAQGADLNVSTCFNLLKTLQEGQLVAFDPDTKEYRLGLRLAELGQLADVQSESRRIALREARRVSDDVGLGCFLLTLSRQETFVVVDKVDSKNPMHVTINIGAAFPPTGSLAAKAWFAWLPDAVVDDVLERHPLQAHTGHSITSAEIFRQELASVRERGYATSEGEYYQDHNAVAAPVFGWDGNPRLIFVVVGTTSQLSGADMARAGEEVAQAAENVTKTLNGVRPRRSV